MTPALASGISDHTLENLNYLGITKARRTAFIARFIVLREGKRTRAHRIIERLSWHDKSSAEELSIIFREIFKKNGDAPMPVERDIKRALAHSKRALTYFLSEYEDRATTTFVEALQDYDRSNKLLFGEFEEGEDQPRLGGWRLPRDILLEL